MRRLALVVIAISGGACLSTPTGLPSDGAPDGPPANQWPPSGVTLDITDGVATDLDHDGFDDLLLVSGGEHPAIYALHGSAGGVGASFATAVDPVDPVLALTTADLDGDGKVELIALSHPALARVSVFHALGALSWEAPWTKDFDGFTVDPERPRTNTVNVLDIASDHTALLLTSSDTFDLADLPSPDASGVAAMAPTAIPAPGEPFRWPLGGFLVDQAGGGKELLLGSYFVGAAYHDVDTVGLTAPAACDQDALCHDFYNNATVAMPCDVDHDGTLDLLGGGASWSVLLAPSLDYHYFPLTPGDGVERALCGDLDSSHGFTDLAFVQSVGAPVTRLAVYQDLSLDGNNPSAVSSAPTHATDLSGAPVHVLVDGDFDHDGTRELVAVAEDGKVSCFHVESTALRSCGWPE